MDENTVNGYLGRIGVDRPPALDEAALADLHRAHQMTIPFENLSIHLGEAISLTEDDLTRKLLTRRRGGFCYELNGTFALLLESLGASVTRVAARVYSDGWPGPPFDHLALLVQLPGEIRTWLADVGFGAHSTFPLRFDDRGEQADPGGVFQLADAEDTDVDVLQNGEPVYRLERRGRALADFTPSCWWQQTSPTSHFTQKPICSRLTERGRISITGRTVIRTEDGNRNEQPLDSDTALLAAYREHFGIRLDRVPALAQPG